MVSDASNSPAQVTLHKKDVWRVFSILLGITFVEFFVALYLVPHKILPYHLVNPLYIALTLAKAFYIVACFMHLKFEKTSLVWAVLIPMILLVCLLAALADEAYYWLSFKV